VNVERVEIGWNDELQRALDQLDLRAKAQGAFEHAVDRIARRTLEVMQNGRQPSVAEIVEYIRDYDAPPIGTWSVDEPRFHARAEEVVRVLNGPCPEVHILLLKRI
jgi:DNA-binding IclR family transcriptional regulator